MQNANRSTFAQTSWRTCKGFCSRPSKTEICNCAASSPLEVQLRCRRNQGAGCQRMRSGRKPGLLFRCKEVLRFKKLRRPGGPPKKETMSEATNITPGTQFQPPIESLHRNAVVGALVLKLRIARYRARFLFQTREELLDHFLPHMPTLIQQLPPLP